MQYSALQARGRWFEPSCAHQILPGRGQFGGWQETSPFLVRAKRYRFGRGRTSAAARLRRRFDVLRRANNYWVAAVSLGYKAGKRVRRKVQGRTKTEVKAKLRELRRDLESGVRPSATYTVGAALDDWMTGWLAD